MWVGKLRTMLVDVKIERKESQENAKLYSTYNEPSHLVEMYTQMFVSVT